MRNTKMNQHSSSSISHLRSGVSLRQENDSPNSFWFQCRSLRTGVARIGFLVCFLLLASPTVGAQLPTADLLRLQPRSCRPGESVRVNLVGTNLEELTALTFTHPGITAKAVMLAADDLFPEPRMQATEFDVTVAEDVMPGIYECRAVGYFGSSTSRPFVVAAPHLKEFSDDGKNTESSLAMDVEVNSVVNGAVSSRGVDWFRVPVRAHERVLVEVFAQRIDSRLDSQLVIFRDGVEVARNRDRFGRDSFVEIQPDTDGEYLIALSDILYRGGSEHFYRLKVSTDPHIDFIEPPCALPGVATEFTVYGRNLPNGTLAEKRGIDGRALEAVRVTKTVPVDQTAVTGHRWSEPRQANMPGIQFRSGNSNSVMIGAASADVIEESAGDEVQSLPIPCEVIGRFHENNDEDSFRFTAEKGTTYCIEVIADRMQSPVDPIVVVEKIVVSADGAETLEAVAENDDLPSLFSVHGKDSINFDTVDSALRFTADADCDYRITLINQFGDGSDSHQYRLAIRQPTPDFRLFAATERTLATNRTGFACTPLLRKGARWGIRILCPRQDEFAGDIVVTAADLPPGVTCKPLTLSGKTDRGVLVVSADDSIENWGGTIRIVGTAETSAGTLTREARFTTLVWGHIFADSIRVRSRLTEEVPLGTNAAEVAPMIVSPAEEKVWEVEVGDKLEIPITLTEQLERVGNLTVEPYELFGMDRGHPTVNIPAGKTEGVLTINFKPNGNFKVEPGRYQFALHATGVAKYRQNESAGIRAAAELQRIQAIVAGLKADLDKAKAASEQGRTDASDKPIAKLEARLQSAMAAQKESEKIAKDAETRAAAKNTKFAAWSELITVRVQPTSGSSR